MSLPVCMDVFNFDGGVGYTIISSKGSISAFSALFFILGHLGSVRTQPSSRFYPEFVVMAVMQAWVVA